jgi:hypothetical protein
MTIDEGAQRDSGERGINFRMSFPELSPAAPRKKRTHFRSRPSQRMQERSWCSSMGSHIASFGLDGLKERATNLEQTRGKVSGQ